MALTTVQGNHYNYLLYKHPDADREPLPMILFLHGAGERGDTPESCPRVAVHSLPKLFEDGYAPRCVAVFPQCPGNSFWLAEIAKLREFITEVTTLYGTDPDRLSLTGVSMGGYGTWILATRYPELFSCIAPVCGGGMPWAAPALKNLPIRAFHGSADTVVKLQNSIDMVEAVKAAGNTDVTLTVFEGVGHNSWVRAYDEALGDFLISQTRKTVE